jgi:hypothetical protein
MHCMKQSRTDNVKRSNSPTLVAPASMLFSTSSFTAVCKSITTWPDVIRWMEVRSMALMLEIPLDLGVMGSVEVLVE